MSFLVELPQSEFNPNAFKGFNPTVGFDPDNGNALAMAWMAQLAYETRLPEKVGAISQLFQLTDVRIVRQAVDNSPCRCRIHAGSSPAGAKLSSSPSLELTRSIC
jgi:hypothetical protein